MPKPLNILSIVPFPLFPLDSGGRNKTFGLLQSLARYNAITVVSPVDHAELKVSKGFDIDPNVLSKPFYRYYSIFSLPQLIRLAKQADIIVLEQPFFGFLALLVSFFSGKKIVVNTHNIEHLRFKTIQKWWWHLLKSYEGFVFKKADAVFFISEHDQALALETYRLSPNKCFISPYGINVNATLTETKLDLNSTFDIPKSHKVLLFFGKMDYPPNMNALEMILTKIIPAFLHVGFTDFTVLVCGKDLPQDFQDQFINEEVKPYVNYVGFVQDLNAVIQASGLLLNPVTKGGGVKTKVLEAIAQHKTVVSTESGAFGIDQAACGEKLQIVADTHWKMFAEMCITSLKNDTLTPKSFFETYSWEGIAKQYVTDLHNIIT